MLGLARIETFPPRWPARLARACRASARAARGFIPKAVFNLPTTRLLTDMLSADKTLRLLCGWQRPGEATFSHAFAAFVTSAQPSRLQDALIEQTSAGRGARGKTGEYRSRRTCHRTHGMAPNASPGNKSDGSNGDRNGSLAWSRGRVRTLTQDPAPARKR